MIPLPPAEAQTTGEITPIFTIRQAIPSAKPRSKVIPGSKAATILALIERPQGATSSELQEVTGWAAHSIRGFMSGVVGKRLGRPVQSTPEENGDRRYRISPATSESRSVSAIIRGELMADKPAS